MATTNPKPRFWRFDREVEPKTFGPSLAPPQQKLFERVASATTKVAGLRANLGAAEQQIADLHAKMETNRGPALLIATLAAALIALALWTAATQRDMARMRAENDASDLLIAKLREELFTVRQSIESSRLVPTRQETDRPARGLDAWLSSAAGMDKLIGGAESPRLRLQGESASFGGEGLPPVRKTLGSEGRAAGENPRSGRAEARQGQESGAEPAPPDLGPTQWANRTNAELPTIEEILTSAQVLSGPVIAEASALDWVSPDDLFHAPERHLGRELVVTGSVMWLLRRFWLQSENGRGKMLIDVAELQSDQRETLELVVARLDDLVRERAQITGVVKRSKNKRYRIAATRLEFVE